jgi:transglutaminase-like putative cysteine protease
MIRPEMLLGEVSREGAEVLAEIYLVVPNMRLIKAGRLPRLYSAGVRYAREPVGKERWQSAAELLRARRGDCEDLSGYLAAEIRVYDGLPARVAIVPNTMGGYHAVVSINGRIEDPSRKLGM